MRFLSLPIIILATVAVVTPSFAQSATLTATVQPNPLKVEITAPNTVNVGEWFDVGADVTNLGAEAISKTSIKLNAPRELSVRSKRKRIGNLPSGETISVKWQAKARSVGTFVVTVEASGRFGGEKISNSDSTIISATDSPIIFWLRFLFGR